MRLTPVIAARNLGCIALDGVGSILSPRYAKLTDTDMQREPYGSRA